MSFNHNAMQEIMNKTAQWGVLLKQKIANKQSQGGEMCYQTDNITILNILYYS